MAELPAHTARAMILRRLPRALRAGLDPEAARGPLAVQLVADADAVSPGIGHALALWVNENVGSCAGLGRWLAAPSGSASLADGALAELERLSALTDDATLREIAEALVLCGSFDRVAPLAGQAASASWAYLDRLLEVGADLHQLSLASRDVQEPYPSLQPPWPNLDDIDLPAPAAVEAAIQAWHKGIESAFSQIRMDIHHLAIGLSVIAGGRPVRTYSVDTLGQTAIDVGRIAVETLTRAATQEALDQADRRHRRELEAALRRQEPAQAPEKPDPPLVEAEIPPLHVLVCPTPPPTGAGKGKDVIRGYEHAIGQALPLAILPDVASVARVLLSEFPYARDAVEAVLGGFAGRPHVHAPPMLLVGSPGSGKTRFVRRLGEALGVGVYRVDGANDSGGSFGGTERRWHSSEPCRPFMAIARHRQANPLMLVDELDKASTRADYGRLWDSMLQALDPENAKNFPDPSLQVEVDISWVTVICTANGTSSLPGPLLDRLRIVRFPEPGAEHLGALLPGILDGLAREAGVDPRFHYPIDGVELAALSARWRGGSIRRLRRAVEAIIRVRDRARGRNMH